MRRHMPLCLLTRDHHGFVVRFVHLYEHDWVIFCTPRRYNPVYTSVTVYTDRVLCGDQVNECPCALYMPEWPQHVDNSVCVRESTDVCMHTSDSPGSQSKGLWYVWVDHDCWTKQSRERSASEIRQASSFDGNHRLPRAVKLLRLKRENSVSKTVIAERKTKNKRQQTEVVLLSLTWSVCSLLERPESNRQYSLLL